MPSGWYNRGVYELVSQGTSLLGTDLKGMLLTTEYGFDRDHMVVSEISDKELSVAGYARQEILNGVVWEDVTKDASYVDFEDPVFGPLGVGETVGFFVLYRDTGDDTTSPLLMCWQVVPKVTNGEEFKFEFSASGASKFWSAT